MSVLLCFLGERRSGQRRFWALLSGFMGIGGGPRRLDMSSTRNIHVNTLVQELCPRLYNLYP